MNKQIDNALRTKIQTYIKNRIDISDLIRDYSIKNEDLSHAIIGDFTRNDTDISDCNLAFSVIGSEDKITSIIRTKMTNCNFHGAKFVGTVWMRSCNAQNCDFKKADVHTVDYQHTNFLGSNFCGAIITIGTRNGIGCRFPKEMFEELCKNWLMKIHVEEIK